MPHRTSCYAVLGLLSLLACTPRAESVEETGAASAAAASVPSLFDRMGGMLVLHAVVDSLVASVAADTRINRHFRRLEGDTAAIRQFKQKLIDQLCEATGGPCAYSGLDMRSAHNGMNLRDSYFDALLEDFVRVLDGAAVVPQDKDELIAILEEMRGDIVTRR